MRVVNLFALMDSMKKVAFVWIVIRCVLLVIRIQSNVPNVIIHDGFLWMMEFALHHVVKEK
jgi:hypothetical protein